MTRAFIYGRVSTEEQSRENHYSLAMQEERCRQHAEQRSWDVVWCRQDVGSGRDDTRPGYQELLSSIDVGAVDVVITYRLDRLSRNVKDIYAFLERTDQAGVGFVSTSEAFDTTTAMGRAMLGMAAVFAQLTREIIGENVREGLAKRTRLGKYLGPGAPLGYNYSVEDKRLSINEEEAEQVRYIFRLYARRKWGMTKMARHLNLRGIRGKRGGQWNPTSVRRLLRRTVYIGRVRWAEFEAEGEHEGIVSTRLYNTVQRILDARKGMPRRRYSNEHLLSGIARCGECGCFLIGFWSKSRPKKGKYEYLYRFYHHRPSYHTDHRECLGVAKSADRLDELVVGAIHKLARKHDGGAPQAGARAVVVGDTVDETACRALRSRLAQTGQDMRRWQDQFDGGLIDEARLQMESVANLRQRAELRTQLAVAQAGATDGLSPPAHAGAAGEALRDLGSMWDNLNTTEQRHLLRILIDKLHVWADRAELTVEGTETIRLPLPHKSPARRRRDAGLR